jgi:hypothetical protein
MNIEDEFHPTVVLKHWRFKLQIIAKLGRQIGKVNWLDLIPEGDINLVKTLTICLKRMTINPIMLCIRPLVDPLFPLVCATFLSHPEIRSKIKETGSLPIFESVEWLLVVCVNLLGKLSFGDSASPPP